VSIQPGNSLPGGLEILRPGWAVCKPGGGFLREISGVVSPAMGSSGTKKTRKGKPRQHLAKVGTPAENSHTMHSAERDVVGNFGVRGRGWMFWGAVVVITIIVIGGVVSLALL
jgi:hypothetical protein